MRDEDLDLRASSTSKKQKTADAREGFLPQFKPAIVITRMACEQKLGELLKTESTDDDILQQQLLQDTLPHRREDIVSGRLSLRKLKKLYPFIFGREQVISCRDRRA